MKCRICHKPINININFESFFNFNFVCRECYKILKPKVSIIPIDYGHLIKYYYFLVDEEYEERLDILLGKAIYKIINNNKKTTVLFIDDTLIPFLKYINFNENITLISIKYEPLELYLEIED